MILKQILKMIPEDECIALKVGEAYPVICWNHVSPDSLLEASLEKEVTLISHRGGELLIAVKEVNADG